MLMPTTSPSTDHARPVTSSHSAGTETDRAPESSVTVTRLPGTGGSAGSVASVGSTSAGSVVSGASVAVVVVRKPTVVDGTATPSSDPASRTTPRIRRARPTTPAARATTAGPWEEALGGWSVDDPVTTSHRTGVGARVRIRSPRAQPTRRLHLALPAPARRQPGGLVRVGAPGVRRGRCVTSRCCCPSDTPRATGAT